LAATSMNKTLSSRR